MSFKREHKRAAVRLEAKYARKNLPNLFKDILIRDISAGGLCFESDEEVETKTIVMVSVYLKDEDSEVILEGEIMWNRFDDSVGKNLNGIQFTEIESSDFQTFLSFYCKKILQL